MEKYIITFTSKFFWYSTVCILSCCNLIQSTPTIQELQKISKSELHLHLGGAWPLDYLQSVAEPKTFAELCTYLDLIEQRIDYKKAFYVFDIIGKIVNTDSKVEEGVVALCKSLSADGVSFVEIRTGLKDLGSGLEGYLQAVLRGIQRGCFQTNLEAVVLLSLRRDTPATVSHQTIDLIQKYRDQKVIGLDLSGISVQGNGDTIIDAIKRAQENNIPIALHMGESPEEDPAQQIKELTFIQPQRIGHGVFLCPEAQAWIQLHKIPVEMCLTSAVKVGMIAHYEDHPALELLDQGHPVAICTDDPLIFKTTLSREYELVARIKNLTLEDLVNLQNKTKEHSFTNFCSRIY